MATAPVPNSRASLLAGLRTGGVRSASGPMNVPHTAAPTGTFNIPRQQSAVYNSSLYASEEEDELADMFSQNLYMNQGNRMHQPMTAAVDGTANRFVHQQNNMGMNAAPPMSPFINNQNHAQLQALQLQMMQVEIARLQTIQAQQYQAELMAQAQRQRVPQQPLRRSAIGFVPPATAGPTQGSFDLRSTAMASQLRRNQQADQLRSKLGHSGEDQLPMTAALNGKFGTRNGYSAYDSEEDDFSSNMRNPPATPNYTTVISGGTSLGGLAANNVNTAAVPSKSDAATSWRRASTNNSVLKNRTSSAPLVKVTPPPSERVSPPPIVSPIKTRPQPLTFTAVNADSIASTVIVSDGNDGDDSSSASSRSGSSPSTPRSASSIGEMPPLSPREEASKKLYEGLGIGRPAPTIAVVAPTAAVQRLISHPVRQPKGPPSNNEELAPKNFATRSRRKAIGALLDARERREVVEAY